MATRLCSRAHCNAHWTASATASAAAGRPLWGGIRRPPAAAAVVAATATAADRSSRAHVSCPVAPSSDRHDPSAHHQPSPAVALRAAVD